MNGVQCEVFQVIYNRDCSLLSLSVEMVLSKLRRVSGICLVFPNMQNRKLPASNMIKPISIETHSKFIDLDIYK